MKKKKVLKIITIVLILIGCTLTIIKLEHRDLYNVYFYETNEDGRNLKTVNDVGGKIDYVYPDDHKDILVYLTKIQMIELKFNKRVEFMDKINGPVLSPV
jgi:uncharacterized protein YxeA